MMTLGKIWSHCGFAFVTLCGMVLIFLFSGCGEQPDAISRPKPATAAERAKRRAYEGAPPVVPHKPLKADCVTCHTTTGQEVAQLGFAPANPHRSTSVGSAAQNCRQCHLFQNAQDVFVATSFEGLSLNQHKGTRAFPGAPPMIPHAELMRENCQACHTGPSAREEFRCSHPERRNCRQCHLFQISDDTPGVAIKPRPTSAAEI